MASFLDNVYSLWESLEKSYKEKGGNSTKKEFLLKLCGHTPSGGNKLDLIKASILKEYEGNEFRCDVLSKIFDSLSLHWESVKQADDIEDLDVYVASLVNTSVVVEKVEDYSFIGNLNPYRTPNTVRLDPIQLATQKNFITDVFRLKNNVVESSFSEFDPESDVILFKGMAWKHSFLSQISHTDKFHMAIYTLFSNLEELKDENYCLFVSRKRFTFRGSKVNLVYGDSRVPVEFIERRSLDGVEYIKAEHRNDYLCTPVYCIIR